MLKLILLTSGLVSFWYFLNPADFSLLKTSGEEVLGVSSINQTANISTVKTALMIYCINHQELPKKLNDLYKNELDSEKYLDLETLFSYKPESNCKFELRPK